ncbi:MAG: hypothetical protein WBD55_13400, partial [Dehalococcoidia bacterium]
HKGWWDAVDLLNDPRSETRVIASAWVPPSEVTSLMRIASATASQLVIEASSSSHPSVGFVQLSAHSTDAGCLVDFVRNLRLKTIRAGGSLILTSAPVAVKQAIDVWGEPGSSLDLMKQLKQQFDPSATLNPGRYVGGI